MYRNNMHDIIMLRYLYNVHYVGRVVLILINDPIESIYSDENESRFRSIRHAHHTKLELHNTYNI